MIFQDSIKTHEIGCSWSFALRLVVRSGMLASALASADLPFVCTTHRGILIMAHTLEDAQQHCQNSATTPLNWFRHGHRWIAEDTRTGVTYSVEQLLF
ncbi:hypothetical protein Q0M94_20850 (plasmid) [Deinococcus radiomollis]|uniref:hypothetical protein n=1 Tax=Deinococcus radiomollis TaxID=468916 RepID=UPI003891C23A